MATFMFKEKEDRSFSTDFPDFEWSPTPGKIVPATTSRDIGNLFQLISPSKEQYDEILEYLETTIGVSHNHTWRFFRGVELSAVAVYDADFKMRDVPSRRHASFTFFTNVRIEEPAQATAFRLRFSEWF